MFLNNHKGLLTVKCLKKMQKAIIPLAHSNNSEGNDFQLFFRNKGGNKESELGETLQVTA